MIGCEPETPHPRVPWARARCATARMVALCAMYFGAIYGWYFYLTWLPTYLLRARGFDLHAVGWLAALPLLAIALGSLVGGSLSDVLTRRFGARTGLRAPGLVGLPLAALAILGGDRDAGSAHRRLLPRCCGRARGARRRAGVVACASRSAAVTAAWCRAR